MKSLEVSTITILHTLSTLDKKELIFLVQVAQATLLRTSNGIDLPMIEDSSLSNEQMQSLLKKFNIESVNDLIIILKEINFPSMMKEFSFV